MPPKRKVTSSNKILSSPPPPIVNQSNDEDSLEAELKFDKEVFWCISQFEKLIKSGKINDAKKNESIKAIYTLKKSTTPKIQKIQLMKQYFKDYKAKMAKEEEMIVSEAQINFESQETEKSKGIFYKKKIEKNSQQCSNANNGFLFNFSENSDNLKDMIKEMEKL